MFFYSFNKSYFLDCVENWWIRKSRREHFSYKWVIDRPVYWDSLVAQLVKIQMQYRRTWFHSWIRKIPWKRDKLPTPAFLVFPGFSDGKDSICNEWHMGSIPGLGKSPGEGHGNSTSTNLLGLISESYCPEMQLLIALTPSFNMSGFMHELGERLS